MSIKNEPGDAQLPWSPVDACLDPGAAIRRLAEDGESVVEATVIAAFLLEAEPLGVAIGQRRVNRVVSPEHGPHLQFG